MRKRALNKLEKGGGEESAGSIPAPSTDQTLKLASNGAFFILDEKTVPKSVLCKKTYRKRFLKENTPYKLPTIVRGKDWFVKYSYELPDQPGTYKDFRVRDGINYIHDLVEKEEEIQKLRDDVEFALTKKNYSPFSKRKLVRDQIQEKHRQIAEKQKLITLETAVKWVIATKAKLNRSKKYLREFNWLATHFIPWCSEHHLERINEPTIDHIELFLSEKLEEEEWVARTYNNKISILTTFFKYLAAKRKMPDSPIKDGMLERIKNRAEKNKYYDQVTLDRVVPKIQMQPSLQRFIRWTYYTCARGTELRGLQIKNIDIQIKKIVITAESGKTGEYIGKRNIPLCQELGDLIAEEKLKDLPWDWYVFGSEGVPGPEPANQNLFSDIYFTIKKDIPIDFKFTIYSFKHTRVVDLLVAGFDPVKVMYITGHTNWGSFQKYIRELGAVMDEQLIGNTLKLGL